MPCNDQLAELSYGSPLPVGYSAMPDTRSTVFIVDDDISVREALEALIQVEGWEAHSFASAQEFLNFRPGGGASCLVLDVSLPGLSGLELQDRLGGERPDMPI